MFYSISPDDPRLNYGLLTGAVVPRPIAWMSTVSEQGVANLAPYSFFTVASVNPPVLCVVQVTPRDREQKDTLNNLAHGSDCVVNVVSKTDAEAMNQTCANYSSQISEFDAAHITACESRLVRAPGVASALVRFECKLREIKVIAPDPMGGQLMLLDVLGIHVADEAIKDELIDPDVLQAIGKMGADGYTVTTERFDLSRPR